jgi:hypothetical protein
MRFRLIDYWANESKINPAFFTFYPCLKGFCNNKVFSYPEHVNIGTLIEKST